LLKGTGGFSITLGFWLHIHFLDEVVQCTLQFRSNNNDGMLMLINVLEFLMAIINYCAALRVVWTSCPVIDNPHPVILNATNNSSALSWTLHTCKQSKIGQMLTCFLCSLLINLPLGINSQWISTIITRLRTTFLVSKNNLTLIHLLHSNTLFSNRHTQS
jgi:hypothetical protein